MSIKQKKHLIRILIASIFFVVLEVLYYSGFFSGDRWVIGLIFALLPYLISGYDVILKSFRNIAHGQVFDENFLMTLATIGAFGIREYPEAAAVMLLYQVGEFFQDYAAGKSRKSISQLMDIAPERANVERNGILKEVSPDDVAAGEIIIARPGEKIPLDGIVEEGDSAMDTSSLTGESVPRMVKKGDQVISGCVNVNGTLKIRTTKTYEDSTVAKILDMVETATDRKTRVENFVTRFARIYTPMVTVGAVLLAFIPPLFMGQFSGGYEWSSWIHRACIFLVVSCPCALVISVPLGFFGGIGASSRIGVLVKGSNYLEALSQVRTIVFDKTGTLTRGEFRVTKVLPSPLMSGPELLQLAAFAENYSTHPIAESIRDFYGEKIDGSEITDAEEIAGRGIRTYVKAQEVLAGNAALMREEGISFNETREEGTVVYIARSGLFAGAIVISDTIKDGVREALSDIKRSGVRKTVMLTGDKEETALAVAREIGIDEVHAQMLPLDKVRWIEKEIESEGKNERTAFAGDGINDAPVLMRSDVGIAMGTLGSDAAIEAADIVLMDDDIGKIARASLIARKTLSIIHTNIIFAITVKVFILALGAIGLADMWMAIFSDVGVLIICILNAMRLINYNPVLTRHSLPVHDG